jgi:hypothetical protein
MTYYKVIAKHSGKCLDVAAASLSDGANIRPGASLLVGSRKLRWSTANRDRPPHRRRRDLPPTTASLIRPATTVVA